MYTTHHDTHNLCLLHWPQPASDPASGPASLPCFWLPWTCPAAALPGTAARGPVPLGRLQASLAARASVRSQTTVHGKAGRGEDGTALRRAAQSVLELAA